MEQKAIRQTAGRGRRYDSILDAVGDTATIRINNLGPDGVHLYVKADPPFGASLQPARCRRSRREPK